MSGFFSLGGGYTIHKEEHQHHENDDENSIITPNSLYLFKNEEIYTKGFELWQQYYQFHHQNRHQHLQHDLCLNSNGNEDTWKMMRQGGGYGMGSIGGGGVGINCQDCGNQAKKDCQHMRCRTCCKSRGFQCQTHVKSTWVPAAKRRERQQQLSSLQPPQSEQESQQQQQHSLGNQQLSLMMRGVGVDQNPKRLREDHQLMTTVGGGGAALNLHHHSTSSGLEVGHFPAEITSPATFRCVRVSAVDEAEEQLAYQTAVNIGGHLFKGILYDRGPENRFNHPGTSSGTQHQQLDLITSGTTGVTVAAISGHQNVSSIDPSSIYPTPLNAFMAGTQFFPPPRS